MIHHCQTANKRLFMHHEGKRMIQQLMLHFSALLQLLKDFVFVIILQLFFISFILQIITLCILARLCDKMCQLPCCSTLSLLNMYSSSGLSPYFGYLSISGEWSFGND